MQDVVELYLEETEHIAALAPRLFREWSGVFGVACALGRRVHTQTIDGKPIYPNLFVCLVAESGTGKTEAFNPLAYALSQVDGLVFSPEEITHAELIHHMGKVFPLKNSDGRPMQEGDRTYVALIAEIATFFPEGPGTTLAMQALARIWECAPSYKKSTKTSGRDRLHWHVLNMVSGAQPDWFSSGFPTGSFNMGFPARTIFVFWEGTMPLRFSATERSTVKEYRKMWAPFMRLSRLRGFVPFTPGARDRLQQWYDEGCNPPVTEPLLQSYNKRRHQHLAKLALIFAMSKHPERLCVELEDLERAMELLFRTERDMPRVVAAAGGNIYAVREEQVVSFVERWFLSKKRACPEWEVAQRLGRVVPSHMIAPLLDALIARRLLQSKGKAPDRELRPGVKR